MKPNPFLILLFLLFFSSLSNAQIQTEDMRTIYSPIENKDNKLLLNPGEKLDMKISFENKEYPVNRFLRVIGGVKMPGKFAPRGEEFFRQAEYLIDENLDSINTYKDRYSLYFKGKDDPFERHVYNRITGLNNSGDNTLKIELPVKKKNFKVSPDGDFGIELQLYYKKEGRHSDDIYDQADSTIFIPIEDGNSNFKVLKSTIPLPKEVVTILVRIGGTKFSGECWVEAPQLSIDKEQIFSSPFIQNERRANNYNYWVGINLATRSWPKWKLTFNNRVLFDGHIFDRASDIADFYIKLPNDLKGEGKLSLTLEKEANRIAFPYELRSVQLIEESARDFEIASTPRFVSVGDTTGILIETNRPDLTLHLSSTDNIRFLNNSYKAENTGLHVIQFVAEKPGIDVNIQISDNKEKRTTSIQQVLIKEKDGVYLSSGEDVYLDKECDFYNYFFKWYMRERIGNWFQFRPSYQWSGVRITDDKFVKHYTSLLNKLHIPYAWQVEGRTLAATRINPSLESLQSPMFRGKQAHENDGGYYYWNHFLYNGLHSDLAARTRPYGGIFAKRRPIFTDHGIFIHYDTHGVKNMQDGADKLVANFSYSRGESTRHTGPSVMFRYLYQAGYEWLGAEQMYGAEDVVMSALRGASRAYGKKDFGTLHAVQWGSHPFTDPKHSLRLYMSLAVAYMHGASHMNTEEGLWTDEYANDRYTEAGKQHLFAQHQVLDYIETHSRKGELYTKIGVIQGRNDAWKSFARGSIWTQAGEEWMFNEAMESFDLLKVFYPENNIDFCSTVGLFTSTPYGPVDILPIEASLENMKKYKTLIFLGWNTFNNYDFIRIKNFVEQGGTLLLTASHLNSELAPNKPVQFPEDDTVIKTLLGEYYKSYKERTEISLGKGRIIYYPEKVYPINGAIKESYISDMKQIACDVVSHEYNNAWVQHTPSINFSVWDSNDFRTIYLLNVNWETEEKSRLAKFVFKDKVYEIQVERYEIKTIRCSNDVAAMMNKNTSDILEIEENEQNWIITCQTTEPDTLFIFNPVTGEQETKDITTAGIHTVAIQKTL